MVRLVSFTQLCTCAKFRENMYFFILANAYIKQPDTYTVITRTRHLLLPYDILRSSFKSRLRSSCYWFLLLLLYVISFNIIISYLRKKFKMDGVWINRNMM